MLDLMLGNSCIFIMVFEKSLSWLPGTMHAAIAFYIYVSKKQSLERGFEHQRYLNITFSNYRVDQKFRETQKVQDYKNCGGSPQCPVKRTAFNLLILKLKLSIFEPH